MFGSYYLLVKFGDNVIPLSSSSLRELTIVQDINRFLPEIRLRIDDVSGAMTHTSPFDKTMSEIYIEFARNIDDDDKNAMTFDVYRRKPLSIRADASTYYDIIGLLKQDKLFSPNYSRGFFDNITNILTTISKELGVDKTEISPSLSFKKKIIQPSFTNAQLLNYLKSNLLGTNGEYGYKSFIKVVKGKKYFIFKSLDEFIQDQVVYKFIVKDTAEEDFLPIYEYSIFDNYKINEIFSSTQQSYSYYDYENGELKEDKEETLNYVSLSDYFLIDKDDLEDNIQLGNTGRSNEFTSNFKGKIKNIFSNRLLSLSKMWITTEGLPSITPGKTILVFFPQGIQVNDLYSYQYSGFWLVERVVHNFGDVFLTKLLLTRQGLDTDKKTTLIRANKKKKA